MIARQEQVPQPFGARLLLQVLDDLRRPVAVRAFRLLAVEMLVGNDMRVQEGGDLRLQFLRAGGMFEVHRRSPSSLALKGLSDNIRGRARGV